MNCFNSLVLFFQQTFLVADFGTREEDLLFSEYLALFKDKVYTNCVEILLTGGNKYIRVDKNPTIMRLKNVHNYVNNFFYLDEEQKKLMRSQADWQSLWTT